MIWIGFKKVKIRWNIWTIYTSLLRK